MNCTIKIPIYNQRFKIILTEEESDKYMAYVDNIDNVITAVFVKRHLTLGIIVHEVVHIVNFIFERIGLSLNIIIGIFSRIFT